MVNCPVWDSALAPSSARLSRRWHTLMAYQLQAWAALQWEIGVLFGGCYVRQCCKRPVQGIELPYVDRADRPKVPSKVP